MTQAVLDPPAALTLPLRRRDELLRRGELDPGSWRALLLRHIRSTDPEIRALADFRPDDVADPGIPTRPTVVYKDTIDVRGRATRLGITSGYRCYPERSARVVDRLAEAGYRTVGKAATTEVSIGAVIPSRNPRYRDVSAGGSSSGSGAAVAAAFADLSVCTDSGGSARWPAVYCGAVGLRLGWDPAQLDGVTALSPRMESLAVITRTADDLAWLWQERGLREALLPEPPGRSAPGRPRFALVADCFDEPLDPQVAAAVRGLAERLAKAGHTVSEVRAPWWDERESAWQLLLREAWDAHAARGTETYQPSTRAALERGSRITDARLRRLLDRQRRARAAADEQFAHGPDVLLLPLDPHLADRVQPDDRPSTVPVGSPGFTIGISFAGLPALALPVAHASDGSPLGVQLVARGGAEDVLVSAGRLIEQLI
ncbi:amidase family protein [Streptacidiphilus melanogenes]|uniref:amidase family protein n=1 Tax=Streptacidiphilus melanogenes TaxID=411235 RepID=UPI0005AA8B79|nr:amidase family protein [Streptacidiphilus melanogenes]